MKKVFSFTGRTTLQNDCYNYYKSLLNWRKGNDIIAKGSMTQWMVQKEYMHTPTNTREKPYS